MASHPFYLEVISNSNLDVRSELFTRRAREDLLCLTKRSRRHVQPVVGFHRGSSEGNHDHQGEQELLFSASKESEEGGEDDEPELGGLEGRSGRSSWGLGDGVDRRNEQSGDLGGSSKSLCSVARAVSLESGRSRSASHHLSGLSQRGTLRGAGVNTSVGGRVGSRSNVGALQHSRRVTNVAKVSQIQAKVRSGVEI